MDYLSLGAVNNISAMAAQGKLNRQTAGDEFAKIFYKEMLKQVFENTSASMGDENSLTTAVNQDIFIEKLAEEMVRKNQRLIDISGEGRAK